LCTLLTPTAVASTVTSKLWPLVAVSGALTVTVAIAPGAVVVSLLLQETTPMNRKGTTQSRDRVERGKRMEPPPGATVAPEAFLRASTMPAREDTQEFLISANPCRSGAQRDQAARVVLPPFF
jgi:hypothetical protein